MRLLLLSVSILVLWSSQAIGAPFKVPPEVYSVDQLEEAQAAAEKSAKPLGFLMSDTETESIAASTTALFRELRAKAVLVFVASGTSDWKKLPVPVQQALLSPASGRYTPCAVVLSPDLKSLIASIPSTSEGAHRRRVYRAAEKLILEATAKMEKERKSFDSIFKKPN